MFWKKKKEGENMAKTILGMIMLHDENSFNLNDFFLDLKKNYGYEINDAIGDTSSLAFTLNDELVGMGYISAPIPNKDIEQTAVYAYNWMSAVNDLQHHRSHIIISILNGTENQVKRFKIFTQIICSILRTTDSIGVYMGNQSLLIPKKDYIYEASLMNDHHLPLRLWIYFGLRITDKGESGYTYGLKEFNKNELEILNSTKDINAISLFLLNISHYLLQENVTFKDGQTCGFSEDEKIEIKLSAGKFNEGDTFKLLY
jgi:hypothetical protein